jgi:hypothetical protein
VGIVRRKWRSGEEKRARQARRYKAKKDGEEKMAR